MYQRQETAENKTLRWITVELKLILLYKPDFELNLPKKNNNKKNQFTSFNVK